MDQSQSKLLVKKCLHKLHGGCVGRKKKRKQASGPPPEDGKKGQVTKGVPNVKKPHRNRPKKGDQGEFAQFRKFKEEGPT